MPVSSAPDDEQRIQRALQAAGQTRLLRIGRGVRHEVSAAVDQLFGTRPVMIVADANTFAAAGQDVLDGLRHAGCECSTPFVFDQPDLYAEFDHVKALARSLRGQQGVIPVAVGAGTINDLTKLASFRLQRPYLVVATAASMDGYSSSGASIAVDGSKRTFDCAAPAGILADLDVIEAAPEGMSASGYADLLAKSVAGADWLVAATLAVDPMDPTVWEMLHSQYSAWVANPDGVRRGDSQAIHSLMLGLTMSGFAIQRAQSTRPASGADHQFCHLWDMQHLTYQGAAPSHGFKVGIGTLASSALYEQLLTEALDELDIHHAVSQWPDFATVHADIANRFDTPVLAEQVSAETRLKYVNTEQLQQQLCQLRVMWPRLRNRLRSHLVPFDQTRQFLAAAGCPSTPHEIGISHARLKQSYWGAYYIRRRFTVLDLAVRTGLLASSLDRIFGDAGRWPETK